MYCETSPKHADRTCVSAIQRVFHLLEASGTFLLGISKHRVLIKNNVAMFPEQAVMFVENVSTINLTTPIQFSIQQKWWTILKKK